MTNSSGRKAYQYRAFGQIPSRGEFPAILIFFRRPQVEINRPAAAAAEISRSTLSSKSSPGCGGGGEHPRAIGRHGDGVLEVGVYLLSLVTCVQ